MNVPVVISKNAFRSMLVLQKHSPTLLFAGGIAGIVGSTVLACRATLKLVDDLQDMEKELSWVRENKDGLSEEDQKRALALVYGVNTMWVAKLYAPPIILGVASIGALTGSHVTLTRRNAGLTAAYAAVSKAYDEYRVRVKEELGDDKELNIYHAAKIEKIETDDGRKESFTVADPNKWSPYARFFDECSRNFQKNPELNRLFVQCQQNYANDLLHARGHVFLNEVYDMLGLERSKAGAVVGWTLGTEGDNYVDFGIFEAGNDRFVNGLERSILLDFNVDGVIFDKI